MSPEASGDGAFEMAVRRLERAVALLEARLSSKPGPVDGSVAALFDDDRLRLSSELDASRSREKALEIAGAQASAALNRAMSEIRDVLGEG
jgi:hypothetical protein